MANEIHVDYPSGSNLYAVIRNSSGQVWYPAGQAFEIWGYDHRDADDYDISLTDKSGDIYIGNFDSNIAAGRYTVQVRKRAGANPADSDETVASGEIIWTGSGELTADKVLANKAVQNKSTGAIENYDNDGSTVILTHTLTDGASTITRTPS